MYRYRHGTIVIGSALPLPDLISDAALIGDSDCDVFIHPGAVSESLPDVTVGGPLWQVAPDGAGGLRVLITIRGIARFLLTGGREVLVEAGPAVAERPDRLLTWLYGTVFSGLLLQRGTLPLHVASIRTPMACLPSPASRVPANRPWPVRFCRGATGCWPMICCNWSMARVPTGWAAVAR
ncbi:hypothetical protein ACFQ4K_13655 [Tistrella bauzanensis]